MTSLGKEMGVSNMSSTQGLDCVAVWRSREGGTAPQRCVCLLLHPESHCHRGRQRRKRKKERGEGRGDGGRDGGSCCLSRFIWLSGDRTVGRVWTRGGCCCRWERCFRESDRLAPETSGLCPLNLWTMDVVHWCVQVSQCRGGWRQRILQWTLENLDVVRSSYHHDMCCYCMYSDYQ